MLNTYGIGGSHQEFAVYWIGWDTSQPNPQLETQHVFVPFLKVVPINVAPEVPPTQMLSLVGINVPGLVTEPMEAQVQLLEYK
ncbi:MAG: hypothetical protein WBW41_16015 [Verrucomicrobiia bacterium]